MTGPVSLLSVETPRSLPDSVAKPDDASPELTELGKRFEQMLWAEMLSHAGLEEAFTRGGGEAASAFSRFVVEAIARDLAEREPLGLADAIQPEPETDPSQSSSSGS